MPRCGARDGAARDRRDVTARSRKRRPAGQDRAFGRLSRALRAGVGRSGGRRAGGGAAPGQDRHRLCHLARGAKRGCGGHAHAYSRRSRLHPRSADRGARQGRRRRTNPAVARTVCPRHGRRAGFPGPAAARRAAPGRARRPDGRSRRQGERAAARRGPARGDDGRRHRPGRTSRARRRPDRISRVRGPAVPADQADARPARRRCRRGARHARSRRIRVQARWRTHPGA